MRRPCVIARLAGGLGNQLFMYAFARALATRNGVPLYLDTVSGFARDFGYRRRFVLDYLIPPEPRATPWQTLRLPLIGRGLQKLARRFNARRPLGERNYLIERQPGFDAEIHHLCVTRPLIVEGYWQSPRYFDDIPLREMIGFPEALVAGVAFEANAIRAANAVCLAIRRYEEIPGAKNSLHILDADYFRRAMARIEEQVENPHYFVFAQDMQWARDNIESRHRVTFAQGKDPDAGAVQDLYLMTQCRHFILSNSSLHWWGAWLGTAPTASRAAKMATGISASGPIVLAPKDGWMHADTLPCHWQTFS